MSQEHLDRLLAAMGDARQILILPHNDPDPDAIASALALRYVLAEKLGVAGEIAYRGIVGRAENRALVRYLGYPLSRLISDELHGDMPIALVDTQPGVGNNALPPGVHPTVVIDHHGLREATAAAAFADVRPGVGATSTILTQYVLAAGLEPPPPLATALFYGIKADTMGLGRAASPPDTSAYLYLLQRMDPEALGQIEHAQVPAAYFRSMVTALRSAQVYGQVVISHMGQMDYPDMAAEMADLLLRLEGAHWIICMGQHQGFLILAVRTRIRRRGAGQLVREIVGSLGTAGGHGTMAGGQIALQGEDPQRMASHLVRRALQWLGVSEETQAKPLT
jgi:nanoRNase/pAp phosphatase (c-di-AMP/oligoRNAs hydrolase)